MNSEASFYPNGWLNSEALNMLLLEPLSFQMAQPSGCPTAQARRTWGHPRFLGQLTLHFSLYQSMSIVPLNTFSICTHLSISYSSHYPLCHGLLSGVLTPLLLSSPLPKPSGWFHKVILTTFKVKASLLTKDFKAYVWPSICLSHISSTLLHTHCLQCFKNTELLPLHSA